MGRGVLANFEPLACILKRKAQRISFLVCLGPLLFKAGLQYDGWPLCYIASFEDKQNSCCVSTASYIADTMQHIAQCHIVKYTCMYMYIFYT